MSNETLIVGSGLAGLLTAIDLAESGLSCSLVTKSFLPASNTAFAQGGIAAVTPCNAVDSVQSHIKDTLNAGAGLSNPEVVELIVSNGYALIQRLMDLGVSFDTLADNMPSLAKEGGHTFARILHRYDTTGHALSSALIKKVRTNPRITVIEHTSIIDLIIDADGFCRGAVALVNGRIIHIWASAVVLATGGLGRLYSRTTNPEVATGDGIALAYRAGAKVIDMEFVQFHPTALMQEGAPAFLISEVVRGAGAVLLDSHGKRFAQRFHPSGELATRDVVARAVQATMREQNIPNVWLDMRTIKANVVAKFPNIIKTCRQFGIDPVTQPIPVAPAAHYFMGGILTDINGQSSIPNLYAAGECASIGLHGANRLASNSLLEAGVMAMRVARSIIGSNFLACYPEDSIKNTLDPLFVFADPDRLPTLMYEKVGLEREEGELMELIYKLSGQHKTTDEISPKTTEQANMLTVSRLIAGSHWRTDFPSTNNSAYLRRYYQSIFGNGWLDVVTNPALAPMAVPVPAPVSTV